MGLLCARFVQYLIMRRDSSLHKTLQTTKFYLAYVCISQASKLLTQGYLL